MNGPKGRHNVTTEIRYFEIASLTISAVMMFFALKDSWKNFHPKVSLGFLLFFPSFCFLLMSCALITTITNEIVLCVLALIQIAINTVAIAKSYRSIGIGKGLLSIFLNIVFPIIFLPSTRLQDSQESVCSKCSANTKNQNLICSPCSRTFFWLMIAKKCFLFLILSTNYIMFQ